MKMRTTLALSAGAVLIAISAVTAETQMEKPDPMAKVRALIDAQVMTPLKASPTRMYSRVMLMPPTYELQPALNYALVPFRVRTARGGGLLGLVSPGDGTVHLLDTTSMHYVPAAKHPSVATAKVLPKQG